MATTRKPTKLHEIEVQALDPARATCVASGRRSRGCSATLPMLRGSVRRARRRAVDEFLGDRHLAQYGAMFGELAGRE